MNLLFSLHPSNGFVPFSFSHLTVLVLTTGFLLWIYRFRKQLKKEPVNARFRYFLAYSLLIVEFIDPLKALMEGTFHLTSLPLQLCDVSLFLSVWTLLTKSYKAYEFVYFIGLGGAGQALLTPDLSYGFPHYYFFEFFFLHGGIIVSCLFMTWVEGYRPRFFSIIKTMAFLNVYMLFILWLNHKTNGNYLYLAHKPEHISLLNYLGPYPWYIMSLEIVALLMFIILYLPFSKKRRK